MWVVFLGLAIPAMFGGPWQPLFVGGALGMLTFNVWLHYNGGFWASEGGLHCTRLGVWTAGEGGYRKGPAEVTEPVNSTSDSLQCDKLHGTRLSLTCPAQNHSSGPQIQKTSADSWSASAQQVAS